MADASNGPSSCSSDSAFFVESVQYLQDLMSDVVEQLKLAIMGVIGQVQEQEQRLGIMMEFGQAEAKEINRISKENEDLKAQLASVEARLSRLEGRI